MGRIRATSSSRAPLPTFGLRLRQIAETALARWLALATTAVLATMALAGCSDAPYELAQVRGTVFIDGRPFTHGKVMFAPVGRGDSVESGKPAFGVLQSDGSFTLSTYGNNDGAVIGDHWVTIIAIADPAATPAAAAPGFSRVAVPQKQLVEAGKVNQVDIKITKQDVAKYGRK